jgi:hypothetical protein
MIVHTLNGDKVVEKHLTSHAFTGMADEFGQVTLRDFISRSQSLSNEFAALMVWDSEREGVGEMGHRAALVTTDDLDSGPFPPTRLEIDHYTYYVVSDDYSVSDDEVLGGRGADVVYGVPHGLIVQGSGPALKVRTGHQSGYITVDVSIVDSAPAADLAAWEAVEQATIRPRAEVHVYDHGLSFQDHFPDLTGGRRTEYLAIRVSVRGRGAEITRSPAVNPRRVPLEHHLIEAWPVAMPTARDVLKRDETTDYWEMVARNVEG